MIYALIAFGYQLTFATSKTMNFGQGEAVAVGALLGLTLSKTVGFWLAIPLVFGAAFVYGLFVVHTSIKPALAAKSEFAWIMATIAFGIICKNCAETFWGKDFYKFPGPFEEGSLAILGARVLPMELLVVVGAVAIMVLVEAFNRGTIFGKAVVATSSDSDAASLMGINTNRVVTFSYGLSTMTAMLAGVLVAPITAAGAAMGTVLGLKAIAVAVIGGLESGFGIILGGILLGVVEAATSFYFSTGYKDVPGLILLLAVLAVKPAGIFGRARIVKV
jgi:branched-chain amino acid transport system permease protein